MSVMFFIVCHYFIAVYFPAYSCFLFIYKKFFKNSKCVYFNYDNSSFSIGWYYVFGLGELEGKYGLATAIATHKRCCEHATIQISHSRFRQVELGEVEGFRGKISCDWI